MELKGSKTEKNLMEAFAGESMARNKYTYYASKAKKEGYEQIAAIFEETAGNEKEHAKMWFKELNGGAVPDTAANLLDAAEGENYEWTEMYKNFAAEAKEEGFTRIAALFELVAKIENAHEDRYRKLIENLENGIVFEKTQEVVWICRNCGHLHVGKAAPVVCPTCDHPQAYFEVHSVNY
ncbi:MAG: rubrerythrin [Acutalibacteraceae bacterium]|mgnify:CR=1 FL=1|jgi:rubrerythrin